MTPTLIDGGDDLPISIEDVRVALRIEHSSEDSVIERSLRSAMEFFEEQTLRAVTPGLYEIELDGWPCGALTLERAPVRSIEAVTYVARDGDGDPVTLEAEAFLKLRGDGLSDVTIDGGWPHGIGLSSRPGCARVQFNAGYTKRLATEGERRFRLPAKYEQALILLTGHWFEHREESGEEANRAIILGAQAIMKQARIFR